MGTKVHKSPQLDHGSSLQFPAALKNWLGAGEGLGVSFLNLPQTAVGLGAPEGQAVPRPPSPPPALCPCLCRGLQEVEIPHPFPWKSAGGQSTPQDSHLQGWSVAMGLERGFQVMESGFQTSHKTREALS